MLCFLKLRQVFKDVKGKGAIATLRLFPTPFELRSMQPQDVVTKWKTAMKRQPGLKKAINLAKRSIGSHQAHDAYKLHLEQLLEELPRYNATRKSGTRSH
jgi:transposase